MAQIKRKPQIKPTEISKFLGVNDSSDGQLGLILGEATNMYNFRVTNNFKLKEREGYKTQISGLTSGVKGMWYGKLNGTYFFLFANNGHLYKLIAGVKTDLGTLTNAETKFIPFGNKVYILNGSEYKSFDGTTFQVVSGYVPLVNIGGSPSGVNAKPFESINLLTAAKRMTLRSDGIANEYLIASASPITSINFVKHLGNTLTLGVDYTQNLATKKVTMTVVKLAANVYDDVEIGWTDGTSDRAIIENCRYAMDYSGQTDSRVFLWGNANFKNYRFWTELANGVPSAEYFTATSQDILGSGQYAITDITKQYDRQKIFFEDGGGAMYSYYDFTNGIVSFPVFELNEEVGQVAFNQSQVIKNNIFTLQNGVRAWEASTVRDQTNENLISQRIQDTLTSVDLTIAKTVNWKEKQEYWINVGSIVWIYNYLNSTWYKFDNITATCFLVVNGELYFGTSSTIEKFDITKLNDNGTAIKAVWEMGFFDFGREWQLKFMSGVWVSLNPSYNVNLDVQFTTNNDGTSDVENIFYRLHNFLHQNFEHMSFETSYNPQPFYIEIQAQQFDYIKFILKNSSLADSVTVLSINMPVRLGGKVR